VGNVLATEQDSSRTWLQCACDQIDECCLAGTVRTDQRVARAVFEAEVDIARNDERAEILVQALRLEVERAHLRARMEAWYQIFIRSMSPRTPPRAKTTMKIMNSPIEKYH